MVVLVVGGRGSEARADRFVLGIKTNLCSHGEIIRGDIRRARSQDSFTPSRTDSEGRVAIKCSEHLRQSGLMRALFQARLISLHLLGKS